MLRHLLSLALCVSPAIAIECGKCAGRECFAACYYRQKVLTTEAKYKCADEAEADLEAETRRADEAVAALAVCDGVDQCFFDDVGCDGSADGVDQCFLDGGDCASCCGACTITTDLDNKATTDSCVCYEASASPPGAIFDKTTGKFGAKTYKSSYSYSYWQEFQGTSKNDCVFIEADDVQYINVRNQCLEGAAPGSARPDAERKSMLGTR